MADAELEFKVDTSGIDDLLAKYPQGKSRFMDAVAEAVITEMKDSFNTGPPGRSYDRGKGRVHIASSPGFPPAIDYGDLTNSLRWERRGNDTREIHGAEHGLYLEDSTELDRPFIAPAVMEVNKDIPEIAQIYLGLK